MHWRKASMNKIKIGIVYNQPLLSAQTFREASLDILTQVEAIEKALAELGHVSACIPFTRDIRRFVEQTEEEKVDMVINLCETVEEDPRLAGHPAAVLELLGVPFSGSSSFAISLATDKLATKRMLKAGGIRTPEYLVYDGRKTFYARALTFPVIIKPRFEDASIGIDQDSIYRTEEELREGLVGFIRHFDSLIVEEYVEGREFNISLLGYPEVEALPVAEIDFSCFPSDLYPIVGYKAKWIKDSFEYLNTPRRFPRDLSVGMEQTLVETALRCFHLFMLRDYGRVDVRVDDQGRVFVLEANANPCLSPDAGFPAAIEASGRNYDDFVADLITFALERKPENEHQTAYVQRQKAAYGSHQKERFV
jgi:D-alanine-D-alanine ligase